MLKIEELTIMYSLLHLVTKVITTLCMTSISTHHAITRALKNNTFGNEPTLENYMNRIINFTNKESDLDALPDLRKIYRRIFTSVKHLDDMNGAFNVACDCLTNGLQ